MLRLGTTLALCIAPLLVTSFSTNKQGDTFLGASVASSDAEAEMSQKKYLVAQWHVLETELIQVQHALTNGKNASTPAANKTTAKAAVAHISAKVQVAQHKDVHDDIQDRLASVKGIMKGQMGKAMLKPMLAMLKGLYQDQKERIGDLNKKEEESKKRYATQKAAFDKRIQKIQDEVKAHKFSAEFGANQTRDYTQQFKYWEGVRQRDHKQFHNALKITHGLMAKEKDTIHQYEVALASGKGKDSEDDAHDKFVNGIMKTMAAHKKEDKKEKVSAEMPEVVLLQFCQDALKEVRSALHEMTL
eukprot:gnl/MRDRNA2_/MRDRNA2_28787_c0_seq1.p2 gnl/MRDRNA2_/MRDRNA2_28787_c0~~gnl/MRDRNA2_/MRDRNA2_28787_c0_seq1.p2  ORF type:complete len:302 (+),score=97.97 gnl/MRDRNA2_/MRDRNA2_28787_c0_seq1:92-997(+)